MQNIFMGQRKTTVTPVRYQWSYCSLALSQRYYKHLLHILVVVLESTSIYLFVSLGGLIPIESVRLHCYRTNELTVRHLI